jgi:hypothetical protein
MAEPKFAENEVVELVTKIVTSIGTTRGDLIPILQKVTNELATFLRRLSNRFRSC